MRLGHTIRASLGDDTPSPERVPPKSWPRNKSNPIQGSGDSPPGRTSWGAALLWSIPSEDGFLKDFPGILSGETVHPMSNSLRRRPWVVVLISMGSVAAGFRFASVRLYQWGARTRRSGVHAEMGYSINTRDTGARMR